MRRTTLLVTCLVLALVPVALRAQESKPSVDPFTKEAVAETLGHIASDAMGGRNTPSAELDDCAEFLAKALKEAGIAPGAKDGSYFHRYSLDGIRLDNAAAKVSIAGASGPKVLEPEAEFRLWRGSAKWNGEAAAPLRIKEGEKAPVDLRRTAATTPIFVEVDAGSPLWKAAAGGRAMLARRLSRSVVPVLLVRAGVLPEGELTATVSIGDAKASKFELRNVVGKMPGTELAGEHVLYSAHYDHIGLDVGGEDSIFNGADDDGSGTTAVLQIARAVGRSKPAIKRSLLFVFFSGEEQGLLGSRAFADDPPVDLASIAVNLNLEMLGRPPKEKRMHCWVTGRTLSDFETVVTGAVKARGIATWAFGMEGQLFQASDNASLARKGVVAHSISSSELHEDYHGANDEVDRIDFEHMAAVISGIHEAGLEFANRSERPVYNEKGKKLLKLP